MQEPELQLKQHEKFKGANGFFGMDMAIDTRDKNKLGN